MIGSEWYNSRSYDIKQRGKGGIIDSCDNNIIINFISVTINSCL